MNFSAQKVHTRPVALCNGRAAATAYPNSQGACDKSFSAIKFSEKFQFLKFDERISLNSALVVPVELGRSVGIAKVVLTVVADDFKNALVGAGDAFVLNVEN